MSVLKGESISVFSMKFTMQGRRREIKKMCTSYMMESEATNTAKKIRSNVEIWHYPYYGEPIRLTTIIYKKV